MSETVPRQETNPQLSQVLVLVTQDTTHNTQLCLAYIKLKMHKLFVLNVLILVFRKINCDQSSETYEAKILSQITQNNEYGTHMPAYVKDMIEKLEMR